MNENAIKAGAQIILKYIVGTICVAISFKLLLVSLACVIMLITRNPAGLIFAPIGAAISLITGHCGLLLLKSAITDLLKYNKPEEKDA